MYVYRKLNYVSLAKRRVGANIRPVFEHGAIGTKYRRWCRCVINTGTVAYSLHCPEMGVPFWAVWYVIGMALPAVVGALLGPRYLRW